MAVIRVDRGTLLRCLAVVAAAAVAFVAGAWLESRESGPLPLLRSLKRLVLPPPAAQPGQPAFDRFGRLVAFPGKQQVACPPPGPRREVLLAIGQSNAANHAGQRHDSAHGERIVNHFDGRCYRAGSPLLGASGVQGDSWVLLANKMVGAGLADSVVIVPAAVGGSAIERWTAGGDLHAMLVGIAAGLRRDGLRVTRVVWHQGERDFFLGPEAADAYRDRFLSLVAMLRREGVDAPVYVSVATAGELYAGWTEGNRLAAIQRTLPDPNLGIHAGVDTDRLVGFRDRHDGTHFSASGQEKFTDALIERFRATR